MDAYLAPHSTKHRYWTGLLLFVCVVFYLISALNLSNNPRIVFLTLSLIISCILLLKAVLQVKIYTQLLLELIELGLYFNLLFLSITSFYLLVDQKSQLIVAYATTSTALVAFLCIIIFHIWCTIRNSKYMKVLRNIMLTKRKQMNDLHINILSNAEYEMQTATVLPTSTIVDISPKHLMEYNTDNAEKESSEAHETSDLATNINVVNDDHQTTNT